MSNPAAKTQAADPAGLICKPDVLDFSVNCLTNCSFASTVLYNISGQACNFSVSAPLDGIFRIDPPSGVLKEGQCITLCITLLHSQLRESEQRPSFVFDCVKILEGHGLSINFWHSSASPSPAVRLPPPLSDAFPMFPPVKPGNVILMGDLKKESKQIESVFEGSPIMKLRHVQLFIASDGTPQLRYSHEASGGRFRGFLSLKDACCCNMSSEGRHFSFFSVASNVALPFAICSVDQPLTASGDPGFKFHDDCQRVIFPMGPTTLLANQIVGDPAASDSHCAGAYWTFEMSGNSAWACGLVPVSETVARNKGVLWGRAESIGLHYSGSGTSFPKIKAPPGVNVTVFVEFSSKTCKFCCDGVVVAVRKVPDSEFPLRLGICGHNGSIFNIKPSAVNAELLISAEVGHSILSADALEASKASPRPAQGQVRASSVLRDGVAAGGGIGAPKKSTKELTCMRLEFASAHEFDLWQRALLHAHPNIELVQPILSPPHSLDTLLKRDTPPVEQSKCSLNLLFSFIPDTRPLCEESCYVCMERIWFAQEYSDVALAAPLPSPARGASPGLKGKRILTPKTSSSPKAVSVGHHPSVIWDGIKPECGHPIHTKCALRQLEQLPQPGDRFMTRQSCCGMCRAQFKHQSLSRTLEPFRTRLASLFAKLQQERDALSADVEKDVASMTPDAFLARHVFMLCSGCKETCYAGLHQCMAADEGESPVAEPESPSARNGDACDRGGWRCVACLNPNPEFPLSCSNPDHGENFIAFKCYYCCDVATFKCNSSSTGIRNFCESCHKHGWNAVVIPEHRAGCNKMHPPNGSVPTFSLGCVPCRSKAPFLVHDDKAREEALLKASRAEAQAAEAAAKAVEAAKIAKAAEEVAAARQAEISAHKPQLDHIMGMGFPLEESLEALRACSFVPELALDFIISRAIAKADHSEHDLDGQGQAGAAGAAPADMDFQKFMEHRHKREAAAPLMGFGFSEKDVVAAMDQFGGDMDAALHHLLEAASIGSIQVHPSASAYAARGASRSPSPPPPPSPLPPAGAAASSAPLSIPPAVVAGLVEMGFDEDSVIAALRVTNGNPNEAAMLLLSGA